MLFPRAIFASLRYVFARQTNMDQPASSSPRISTCTKQDYDRIIKDLPEFWDGRDTRRLHHPMLIHEFGNSAFVIRDGQAIAAYLFGLISQTAPVGYVHAVAVRPDMRRKRLGHQLLDHFAALARGRSCTHIKAITTPSNAGSIAFHKSLGMQGEPNSAGVPVVADYAGHNEPRVVFWKAI
ncbi:MAG: GNAT family N-acetyltransferase [Xanthobacteraceae bacterium]|nr:GNAT family N-acetyltransferase [Xanthobacteraceae bacterium]